MPIAVVCDQCFGEFRVKDELAGKRVRCKSCSEPIRVPGGETTTRPPARRRAPAVESPDDWDEPEEELPRPRVKAKTKKKKRRRSSINFDFGQWANGVLTANIGTLLLQLIAGALCVLFLLGFFSPTLAGAFIIAVGLAAVLMMVVGFCAILVFAAQENVICLIFCFFVPFYFHWYWISRWERTGPYVGLFFGSVFGAGATIFCATAMYGIAGVHPGQQQAPPFIHPGAINPEIPQPNLVNPNFGIPNPPHQNLVDQNPTSLYPVSSLPAAEFEIGGSRQRTDGVPGTIAQVSLQGPNLGAGKNMLMRLNMPEGVHQPQSLPCILIAPAGSTLLDGMRLDDENQSDEKAPYIRAGYVVVEYSLDGASISPNGQPSSGSYRIFSDAMAGVANGHYALEFVLSKVPEVNPNRIFVAGHSSAAVLALLLAEHEPRIKGCIAYAPASDVELRLRPNLATMNAERIFPGVYQFIQRSSPKTHAAHLNCPVFLFHAQDDSNEPISTTRAFHAQLQSLGKQSTFVEVPTGDHYESMIREGIPAGLRWLQQLPGNQ